MFALCVLVVILVLFRSSFHPDKVLFSNDGPLGAEHASYNTTPDSFTGMWADLNGLGSNYATRSVNLTGALRLLLGPVGFARFYAPLVLIFLSFSAFVFFRQLRLTPLACILGGLAAFLNSGFFSAACWGVGPQALCVGLNFLALAALVNDNRRHYWLNTVLAGFAVGLGVTEGADIGAMYSVLTALFVVLHTGFTTAGPAPRKLAFGIGRLILVAGCAGFIAVQTVMSLIGTQIKGVAGVQQDAQSKTARWAWSTQWSFPKTETLSLFIPGLFGFRMDTPLGLPESLEKTLKGGSYWGAIGRDLAWDEYFAGGEQGPPPNPQAQFIRYSGGGAYGGVAVVVLALWAALQSFRRKDSIFSLNQRKFVWFWTGLAAVSLLLAFGRFAPFFQIVYALPYASVFRNPAKFLSPFSWSLVILFACGVHGLSRYFLEAVRGTGAGSKSWWTRAGAFEKRWAIGCLFAVAAGLLGWWMYSSNRTTLEQYLEKVSFGQFDPQEVAAFSIAQVGWFVLFLGAVGVTMVLIMNGAFRGPAAKWGGVLLGLVVVVDLARANLPWILHWNYREKYETGGPNPIIRFLGEKPWEHRAVIMPDWILRAFQVNRQVGDIDGRLRGLYDIEWKQQLFPYYDIQSLDYVQRRAQPQDMEAYELTLAVRSGETLSNLTRQWELTNTRYILGFTGFLDLLNKRFDAGRERFRIAGQFDIVSRRGVTTPRRWQDFTAEPSTNGMYALFEFTGALPRAALYANWQMAADDTAAVNQLRATPLDTNELARLQAMGTNEFLTLRKLVSPAFDPHQTVLLANPLPPPNPAGITNPISGTVEFASYASTRIQLKTRAESPAVLLLNDKYDPDWQVRVDGQRAELLRCNFIMRGVYLASGPHTVEFVFKPSLRTLYLSTAALVVALLLLGVRLGWKRPNAAGGEPGPLRA